MKKILLAASVIGLIAVPSVVVAQQSNNSVTPPVTVPHSVVGVKAEAEAEHGTEVKDDSNDTNHNVTAQSTSSTGVKIEQEGTLPAGSITAAQAQVIAAAAHPGSSVNKVEVETEHGTALFSVRFNDGAKVDVDGNGNIVKVEVEKPEVHISGEEHVEL